MELLTPISRTIANDGTRTVVCRGMIRTIRTSHPKCFDYVPASPGITIHHGRICLGSYKKYDCILGDICSLNPPAITVSTANRKKVIEELEIDREFTIETDSGNSLKCKAMKAMPFGEHLMIICEISTKDFTLFPNGTAMEYELKRLSTSI